MDNLKMVEELCELIELQAKLIHQLTIELEHEAGLSECALRMANYISDKEKLILE